MKSFIKTTGIIIGLIVVLSSVFFAIRHFQRNIPPTDTKPEQMDTTGKDAKSIKMTTPSIDKKKPIKKNVDVVFKNGKNLISYKNIPLYSVKKENEKIVSITANGNLAKSLIEKLPAPENATEPVSSKLGKLLKFQKIIRGRPGLEIDKEKTLLALEKAIKEKPEAATLSIGILTRKITGKDSFLARAKKMGLKKQIASHSTLHESHIDDEGRNVNLDIAARKIDGLILQPGEKFSFNKVVGPRTEKYGFRKAGVISRGRVISGLGGGICQVSTALYMAVLKAGLGIDRRHNHSIYEGIDYAKIGLDSGIAWGYKDLCFTNNFDIPVMLSAQSGPGSVTVSVYGEEIPFKTVKIETRNIEEHPYKTKKRHNSKLKEGQVKIVHPGVKGYSVETYRIVIAEDGKKNEERISKDRYLTFNRIEEINN
ncbi:MAG: VanW family protein [Candidatus Rifleibacteriota bacterium]